MQTYDQGRTGTLITDLKPFHCRHCKAVLAYTDGERLVFGDVEIKADRFPLLHRTCGQVSVWRRVADETHR